MKVKNIIIHCTATTRGRNVTAADVDRWHRARGFRSIGYHYLIRLDGTIEPGRSENEIGAHTLGQNATSIGVCYVGGLDSDGVTPCDTRTPAQRAALEKLLRDLLGRYPGARIRGHRDFAAKACPSFDATAEFRHFLPMLLCFFLSIVTLTSCRSSAKTVIQTLDTATVNRSASTDSRFSLSHISNDSLNIRVLNPRFEIRRPDSVQIVFTSSSVSIGQNKVTQTTFHDTIVIRDTLALTKTVSSSTSVTPSPRRFPNLAVILAILLLLTITVMRTK